MKMHACNTYKPNECTSGKRTDLQAADNEHGDGEEEVAAPCPGVGGQDDVLLPAVQVRVVPVEYADQHLRPCSSHTDTLMPVPLFALTVEPQN